MRILLTFKCRLLLTFKCRRTFFLSCLVASGNVLESQAADFCVLNYTHCQELMKSGFSWQLVTAICDECDSLTLCERLS